MTIGLASDDVTKLSNAWQRGKLVLNKGSVPYKSMPGEKSLAGMDYKLLVFTYRCTHSLTSTLLTNEFSVLGQSNARTRSITRGQSFISLSLPNVCHRSGTISPLSTCSLLWNSLPSSLRHPDVKFSRFRNALATYMGFPVTRHT